MPCRNEEATVADVVAGFSASLPGCTVYVYDNGSGDATAARAAEAGAVVRTEDAQEGPLAFVEKRTPNWQCR